MGHCYVHFAFVFTLMLRCYTILLASLVQLLIGQLIGSFFGRFVEWLSFDWSIFCSANSRHGLPFDMVLPLMWSSL